MHFDWTITVGDVLKAAVFLGGFVAVYTKTSMFVGEMRMMMREFPPHRHENGKIRYPKGMMPDDSVTLDTKA